MNREEALSFYHGCDDIEDCWDERFMEHLNFFRTKVPLPSLFQKRIQKLKNDARAASILLKKTFAGNDIVPQVKVGGDSISEVFKSYFDAQNQCFTAMFRTPDPYFLELLAEKLISLTQEMAALIAERSVREPGEVMLSKVPDPMYLIQEIEKHEMKGNRLFSDITNDYDDLLAHEIDRWISLNEKIKENV